MIKPKQLKKGSNIAIISPSCGLPFLFPDIYELGLRNLRELGFNITEMPSARLSPDELYQNPELRASDINRAFADNNIDGIICSIGGYESVRILRYLDAQTILGNPKLIMGFSDATTILSYINTLGLVTFYGPTVMAGFAQMRNLPAEFEEHLKTFLLCDFETYAYKPYPVWTNGYKDWNDKATLGECTEFYPSDGLSFLQGEAAVEGTLWGGCIEVLEFLKSTAFYPHDDFWNGKILFFETSEDKPLPMQVGYMLRNYGVQGALNKINGIIFARPKDYTLGEKEELRKTILDICRTEFGAKDIPVAFGADFGHTDPKVILPFGCKVRLDPRAGTITLMETPFSRVQK
jgi:muramoyltetrapeptide carboxypeptidase LdcA involved in peptidoglycan recycling